MNLNLEELKKKAKDLGFKGVSKRGKYTKQNKGELEELISKAESSGCRILSSVKDLDIPGLKDVTCENLCDERDKFEKFGPADSNLKTHNVGMAFVGMGFLVILGASSWYFFPKRKTSANSSPARPTEGRAATKGRHQQARNHEQYI